MILTTCIVCAPPLALYWEPACASCSLLHRVHTTLRARADEDGKTDFEDDVEPFTFDRIFAHIDQLAPVLLKNADVVYGLQAGFIGNARLGLDLGLDLGLIFLFLLHFPALCRRPPHARVMTCSLSIVCLSDVCPMLTGACNGPGPFVPSPPFRLPSPPSLYLSFSLSLCLCLCLSSFPLPVCPAHFFRQRRRVGPRHPGSARQRDRTRDHGTKAAL